MRLSSNKLALLVIVVLAFASFKSLAQSTYYETFNITGPAVVCADGVTIHTYTGMANATWSINGGVITGNPTASTITVKWNNLTGSLSAQYQEQANCWWDDSSYPPVQYCDTYIYTSNPFNVSASSGGTISGGGTFCSSASGTLTLSGHTGSVIRWEQYTTGSWVTAPNSNTTVNLPFNVNVTTQFRAVLNNTCAPYSAPTSVIIYPPSVGGTINSVSICGYSSQGILYLSSNIGAVLQWESNDGSGWSVISNSQSQVSYNYDLSISSGDSKSVQYRALVQSGACSSVYSSIGIVTLYATSLGGTANASPSLVCSGSSGIVTLGSNIGSVIRWEQNTGSGWTTISNTSTTLSFTNLTVTTQYRAVVKNGTCAEAISSASTATVSPPTAGGTTTGGTTACASASGNITLSGHTGTVQRWEYNDTGSWLTIANTSTTQSYNVSATRQYRAIVKSGVCAEAPSSVSTITINPTTVGGSVSSSSTVCASGSGTLTLTGNTGSVVRWEKSTEGIWTTISNTTTSQAYNVSTTTSYRTVVKSGVCAEATSSTATITVNAATAGGNTSGNVAACASASGNVTLSGYTGTIQRWEYNDTGSWVTIANTTTTQAYNLSAITRQYRAIVKNGIYAEAPSTISTLTVSPQTVAGSVSGGTTACASSSGTLTLNGSTGSVLRWESFDIVTLATSMYSNTTTSLPYSATSSTTFYAVVKSGVCNAQTSSTSTVFIDAASVGGSVGPNNEVYAASASGTLQLNGATQPVVRWEEYNASSWVPVSNTTYSHPYNTSQSTTYRAVVKNGVCPEAASTAAQITVYSLLTVTPPAEIQWINYGNTVQLSSNTPYYSYQWYKDGDVISGEASSQYTVTAPGSYFVQVKGAATASPHNSVLIKVKSIADYYQGTVNAVSRTVVLEENVSENSSLYTLPADKLAQTIGYSDGLGRPFQTIGVGQSPEGGDIVAPVGYSKNGLMDTTFLPYTRPTASGLYRENAIRGNSSPTSYTLSEQYLFYQNTPKVASDNYPYARTLYRNTPDAKVIEQGAPGSAWQPRSTHTVRNTVALNNATTYRVRYWKPGGTTNSNYADNSVMVSVTTDENNNQVRTFTNALGQTVLKQVQIDETLEGVATSWLETYYIYDEFGRLKYQVPPKAMKVLGTAASLNAASASVNELIYTYKYDVRSRLVEKKEPGATTWQFFVYDIYDRLVLIQNADLKAVNKWMYIKYDEYGRAVSQGLYTNRRTRASVQAWVNKAYSTGSVSYPVNNYFESRSNIAGGHGYTNQSFPKDSIQYMGVNYYDSYDFDFNGTPDYSYNNSHLTGQAASNSTSTRGMPTGSKTIVIDELGTITNNWLVSVVFYDQYDRPIQTRSNNLISTDANNISTVIYDFPGKVLKTKSSNAVNRITWQNLVNAAAETDRVKSTSATSAWGSAGASSVQQIPTGTDGWVETTVTETSTARMFGFSDVDVNQHYNTIDYAFYLSAAALYIYENGVQKYVVSGGEAIGDKLRITRTGSTIYYYKNGALVYTSLVPSSTVLTADIAFYNNTATVGYTQISSAQATVNTVQRYDYDHAGRVTAVYHTIDENPEQKLATYEYNELGQLVDKKLHITSGENFLQSVDYRYSIRGWLTSINNSQLTSDALTNDETNDYFGMELSYANVVSGIENTAYYNGNISAIKWKGVGATAGSEDQRSYKYTYDKSDRLKTSTFQAHDGAAWTKEANTLNEEFTYDHNGNIKTLVRNQNQRGLSGVTVTSTPQAIDNLTYTYASNFNRLTKVDDATANNAGFKNGVIAATEYTYGTNGSLTKDDNKGISSITYNILGKPRQIIFTDGRKIDYVYDAAGNKLKMKTWQGTTAQAVTDYDGSFVYVNGVLNFFSSPEGRVVKKGSAFEYEYAIADHQGNTRVVLSSVTPAPEQKTANMEAETNTGFDNYINTVDWTEMNHTAGGSKSQIVHGGYNAQVGVAKSYKVYPGDKVKIEAWAKYIDNGGTGNLNGFATALLSAFNLAAPAVGETGTASAGVDDWGSIVAGGGGEGTSSAPKAFVNILLFDKNYNFLDVAWDQIDAGATSSHDQLMKEVTIAEEGYAYIYISNENPAKVDVYFDDVNITLTKGNIIQYNEYYPFGLQTANSWTRENVTGNNFLGNGGTELNKTSNLYDLDFRNYDPVLGRMNGVDPMASKYASLSPYNFSFNDPVTFTDPSGADPDIYDYNRAHFSGGSIEQIMDPFGGSGYGTAGYTGMYGLGGIISSYNPDYGGPVRTQYWDGSYGNVLPSQRAWAERQGGQSIATFGSVDISASQRSGYDGSSLHNKYEFIWRNGKPKYIGKGNAQAQGVILNFTKKFDRRTAVANGWRVIDAQNLESAVTDLQSYKASGNKITSLVIHSHGTADGTQLHLGDVKNGGSNLDASYYRWRKLNPTVAAMNQLLDEVEVGGTVVFIGCNAAKVLGAAMATNIRCDINAYMNTDLSHGPKSENRFWFHTFGVGGANPNWLNLQTGADGYKISINSNGNIIVK